MPETRHRRRRRRIGATAVVVACALVAAACSSDDPDPIPASTSVVPEGIAEYDIEIGGETRTYGVFSPPGTLRGSPMLVVLHSLGRSAAEEIPIAGAGAFLSVVPIGVDFSWNAGHCCGTAADRELEDVAFVARVIDEVVERYSADPDRVYAAGFSNGAMLAYRLACERPGLLAGAAVVEGTLTVDECRADGTTDLLVVHQTGDTIVPYAGTDSSSIADDGRLLGVETALARYGEAAACRIAGVPADAKPLFDETSECDAGGRVRVVVVQGGTHSWPSGDGAGGDVDATDLVVSFFGLGVSGGA